MVKIESIKPLWDDVVVCRVRKDVVEQRMIQLLNDRQEEEAIQYFEIINVGDDVKSVKVGEVVAIPWTNITEPVEGRLHGAVRQFGITSEKEILGVIERD